MQYLKFQVIAKGNTQVPQNALKASLFIYLFYLSVSAYCSSPNDSPYTVEDTDLLSSLLRSHHWDVQCNFSSLPAAVNEAAMQCRAFFLSTYQFFFLTETWWWRGRKKNNPTRQFWLHWLCSYINNMLTDGWLKAKIQQTHWVSSLHKLFWWRQSDDSLDRQTLHGDRWQVTLCLIHDWLHGKSSTVRNPVLLTHIGIIDISTLFLLISHIHSYTWHMVILTWTASGL